MQYIKGGQYKILQIFVCVCILLTIYFSIYVLRIYSIFCSYTFVELVYVMSKFPYYLEFGLIAIPTFYILIELWLCYIIIGNVIMSSHKVINKNKMNSHVRYYRNMFKFTFYLKDKKLFRKLGRGQALMVMCCILTEKLRCVIIFLDNPIQKTLFLS